MPRHHFHRTLFTLLAAATLASPLAVAHGGHAQDRDPDGWGGYGPCTGPGMMDGYHGQGGYGQGMGPGMMGGYHGQGGDGPGVGPGAWALMNDDQRRQAQTLMEEFHHRQAERGGETMALRQRLMQQGQAGSDYDPQAVAEARIRLGEIQRQMWQEQHRLQQEIYELLDEEQRRRLARPTP